MTNGDEQAGGKLYPVAVDLETKRVVAVGEAVSVGDHAGRAAAMQGLADRVAGLPVQGTREKELEENSATAIRMLLRVIEARLSRPYLYELADQKLMDRAKRTVEQFLDTLCVAARSRREAVGPVVQIDVDRSGRAQVRLTWPGESWREQSDARFNYGLHLYEDIVKEIAFPGSLERRW